MDRQLLDGIRMRATLLALLCLAVGCGTSWAVEARTPTTTVRDEAHQLIAVGVAELAIGTALTIGGGYELTSGEPGYATMIPGTEGQGLSGDGRYESGGSPFLAGLFLIGAGSPVGISGVANLATGLYELATREFVGTKTARPPSPPPRRNRSDDDEPPKVPESRKSTPPLFPASQP